MPEQEKKPQPRRKRARKADGQFKGDNPSTPELNEAWEPEEVTEALPKKNDYSVKKKVEGPSGNTAGKYSRKDRVKPTFGKVYTTYN